MNIDLCRYKSKKKKKYIPYVSHSHHSTRYEARILKPIKLNVEHMKHIEVVFSLNRLLRRACNNYRLYYKQHTIFFFLCFIFYFYTVHYRFDQWLFDVVVIFDRYDYIWSSIWFFFLSFICFFFFVSISDGQFIYFGRIYQNIQMFCVKIQSTGALI